MRYPATIIHGDWSKHTRKRVAAFARHVGGGEYILSEVEQFDRLIPKPSDLFSLASPVLVGFDFPVGLPARYACQLDMGDFGAFLTALGSERFSRWGEPVQRPDEITHARPFYPARPGSSRQDHLIAGHKVGGIADLLRSCERRTADRPAACSLFWTLGGNQVGRAAVAGWTEVVRPLAATGRVAIWPFDGTLAQCLERRPVTIVETYPADAMRQIGLKLSRPWSKRRQSDRVGLTPQLRDISASLEVSLSDKVAALVADGFGPDLLGEDRFDAFVGLLSMIAVAKGLRAEGTPAADEVLRWEGWIFGQSAPGGRDDSRVA